MNTGTPLDLTPFGSILSGIGWLYWLIALVCLWLAFTKPPHRTGKIISIAFVLIVFGSMPAYTGWHTYQARQKLNAAMAQFEMRCKTAGEKINRAVENVDGIVWMKWRPKGVNLSDQFKLDDPYGKDCSLEGCILRLLRAREGAAQYPEAAKLHEGGYKFVETIDPRDGKRYRYTGVLTSMSGGTKEEFTRHVEDTGFGAEPGGSFLALRREPIAQFTARYGIAWDDISTHEDREQWVAGSLLEAIDLQTNEVIAKRVGYLIDKGLGNQAGFRSPWPMAQAWACPTINSERTTWTFATKVMQPTKQGE